MRREIFGRTDAAVLNRRRLYAPSVFRGFDITGKAAVAAVRLNRRKAPHAIFADFWQSLEEQGQNGRAAVVCRATPIPPIPRDWDWEPTLASFFAGQPWF